MTEDTSKRAKRLVTFRELQRERASREVLVARAARESAADALRSHEALVQDEAKSAQADNGTARTAEEIQLAIACVEALRAELENKREVLRNSERALGTKSKALLATHKKVQQMERLKEQAVIETHQMEKKREQSEIDDLAINRKARR
jgi:flagellar export protein FliJ